jgi:fibronectin-binding autotransporter adhesin
VSGTLNLNGGTVTITTTGAAIAGGVNATSNLNLNGGVTLKAGAASTDWIRNLNTAVINSGGAVIDTNGNIVGVSQAFSGAGGLTKAGEGILTVSAAQTYSGGTTVQSGTLALTGAGSINSSTAIQVQSGATLDVSGSTAGKLIIGDGHSLGGGGTIEGDVDFASGANLIFNPTATLTVNGATVDFLGSFGIGNLIGLNETAAVKTYTLIDGSAEIDWTNIVNVGEGNKQQLGSSDKYAYFQSGSLELVVIPEPATSGLLLLGAVAGLGLLRRKLYG